MRLKPKSGKPGELSREDAIEQLLEPGNFGLCMPADQVAELAHFAPEERADIYREAERLDWERREREREPVLRERLETWEPDVWGAIFAERPDMEETLTPDQRKRWHEWRESRGLQVDGVLQFKKKEKKHGTKKGTN